MDERAFRDAVTMSLLGLRGAIDRLQADVDSIKRKMDAISMSGSSAASPPSTINAEFIVDAVKAAITENNQHLMREFKKVEVPAISSTVKSNGVAADTKTPPKEPEAKNAGGVEELQALMDKMKIVMSEGAAFFKSGETSPSGSSSTPETPASLKSEPPSPSKQASAPAAAKKTEKKVSKPTPPADYLANVPKTTFDLPRVNCMMRYICFNTNHTVMVRDFIHKVASGRAQTLKEVVEEDQFSNKTKLCDYKVIRCVEIWPDGTSSPAQTFDPVRPGIQYYTYMVPKKVEVSEKPGGPLTVNGGGMAEVASLVQTAAASTYHREDFRAFRNYNITFV